MKIKRGGTKEEEIVLSRKEVIIYVILLQVFVMTKRLEEMRIYC